MGAGQTLNSWTIIILVILPEVLCGQWEVRHPEKEMCAVRGSTVVIPCTYDYPEGHEVKEIIWFYKTKNCFDKNYVCHSGNTKTISDCKARAEYLGDKKKNCTLRIKNIRDSDAGKYKFRFITNLNKWCGQPGVTLKITELRVAMSSSTKNATVREGDLVNLTCETSDCSLGMSEFIWFKDKDRLKRSELNTLKDKRHLSEGHSTLRFSPVSPRHSGNYSCALRSYEGTKSSSVSMEVEKYRCAVNYREEHVCAARGSTVVIPCTYDYSEGNRVKEKMWCHGNPCTRTPYVCHSENTNVSSHYRDRAECLEDKINGCVLKIERVRHADAGNYTFEFNTDKNKCSGKPGVTLHIAELQVKMTLSTENGTIGERDSVNLTCMTDSCFLNHSEFTWFKDKQRLPETHSTLHLNAVFSTHTGNYSCALKDFEETVSADFILEIENKFHHTNISVAVVGILLTAIVVATVMIIYFKRKMTGSRNQDAAQTGRNQTVRKSSLIYANVFPKPSTRKSEHLQFSQKVASGSIHSSAELNASTEAPIYENVAVN